MFDWLSFLVGLFSGLSACALTVVAIAVRAAMEEQKIERRKQFATKEDVRV